ncbi:MAG: internalization-related competence protein ComEC/Rec2 protein, partial [Parcubacteria group bacterium GW2011_GWB1_42_6]
DIGQGDATFIETPRHHQILIDGGPSAAILPKVEESLPFGDKRIELLILTHPDSDHLNGLIEILKRYEVAAVLETGIKDDSAQYAQWEEIIKEKNIPVYYAHFGQHIKAADNLEIEILAPFSSIRGKEVSDKNNSSIVGKIIYGKSSLLFVGDASSVLESQMILAGFDLDADILQVGHHGSKTSTSAEFLQKVSPDFSVIQVGLKNRYGHPSQETLDRLKNFLTLRTDLSGDIKFECDLERCRKTDEY